jgi:hypothetical protein
MNIRGEVLCAWVQRVAACPPLGDWSGGTRGAGTS